MSEITENECKVLDYKMRRTFRNVNVNTESCRCVCVCVCHPPLCEVVNEAPKQECNLSSVTEESQVSLHQILIKKT